MYRQFLKVATRYLVKNRLYSFINIFGLAIGVASFVLIMLYVNYENSYDKFDGSENVHRVFMDYLEGGEYVPGDANAYIVSGPTLKDEFPEVKEFARLRRLNGLVLLRKNTFFDNNTGFLADPEYFDVFDRKLDKGNVSTALNEPYSIILSTPLAKKIFGNQNPMGKALKIAGDDESTFRVTGIMDKNYPNTHIKNDFLVSFKTFYTWKLFQNDWKFTWNQNEYYTYLKVDKNADIELLNQKVMALTPEGLKNERHHLEPIEDIHLYSNKPYEAETNGSANGIKLLAIIAFITLFLSWMNYMSLSSSKSMERAKEIGIRKVVGAKRLQLIFQFLVESALLNFIAIVLAMIVVYVLLPSFSRFIEQDLGFDNDQLKNLIPYFGLLMIGTSLAAFYPAFVLSRYQPAKVLKGKIQTSKNGLNFRKTLIIGQFIATISLLTGTFVANKQIRFLKDRPIGASLDQLVALNGQILNSVSDSILENNYDTLMEELRESPYVAEVAGARTYPGDDFSNMNSNIGLTFPDGREDVKRIWYNYGVQPEYFDLIGMKFIAGEGFPQTSQRCGRNVVINEKMAGFMGVVDVKGLIGKTIKFWNEEWTVTGVVADYNHFGLKNRVEPMIIRHGRNTNNIIVKFNKQVASMAMTSIALEELNKIWHRIFPESTYNYTFLDQKFAKAFQIFTILAILIASMGLFGLTSYTVVQRKKEIGIRKVNGATIGQILSILNKDFVKWIGLAFIIAVPISWYAMNKWLEGFAYKTNISWWVFALAGISALAIALLTVSWQSFQAAIANPVESLRDE